MKISKIVLSAAIAATMAAATPAGGFPWQQQLPLLLLPLRPLRLQARS